MIVEKIHYGVKCDRCDKLNDGPSPAWWDDMNYAVECATDWEWQVIVDKHYCPDCWDYEKWTPKPNQNDRIEGS